MKNSRKMLRHVKGKLNVTTPSTDFCSKLSISDRVQGLPSA